MADTPNTPLSRRAERELARRDVELSRQTASATAGGGMVQVSVDGFGTVRSLSIDPKAFDGRDSELLADLIMSAITEAQRRVDELSDPKG